MCEGQKQGIMKSVCNKQSSVICIDDIFKITSVVLFAHIPLVWSLLCSCL